MRYITIPDNETIGNAWVKLKIDMDNNLSEYRPASGPLIMFNGHKVLALKKFKEDIKYKIEGSSEIIDVIYKEFMDKV